MPKKVSIVLIGFAPVDSQAWELPDSVVEIDSIALAKVKSGDYKFSDRVTVFVQKSLPASVMGNVARFFQQYEPEQMTVEQMVGRLSALLYKCKPDAIRRRYVFMPRQVTYTDAKIASHSPTSFLPTSTYNRMRSSRRSGGRGKD